MMLRALSFIGIILFLASCNSDLVYEKQIKLNNSQFSKQDTSIIFEFNIEDTIPKYDIILEVNHKSDFGYQNLYVDIQTTFPDNKTINDVVSLELSKSGTEWQGKCGGDECKVEIMLSQHISFNSRGKYKLRIMQYGREYLVEDLNGFVLKVVKS